MMKSTNDENKINTYKKEKYISVSLVRMVAVQLIFVYLNDFGREYRNVNHAVGKLLQILEKLSSDKVVVENNMIVYNLDNDVELSFSSQILDKRNIRYLSKILFTAIENQEIIKKYIKNKFVGNSNIIYVLLFNSFMELHYLKAPLLVLIKEYSRIGTLLGLEEKYIHYVHAIITDMAKIKDINV